MGRLIPFFLTSLLLSACMAPGDIKSIVDQGARDSGFVSSYQMNARQRLVLQDTTSLLVVSAPGEKGLHGDVELGERVNRYLAQRVYLHFRQQFPDTLVAQEKPLVLADALVLAREKGRDYLVYPETIRWDDKGAMLVEDVLPGAGGVDHVSVTLRLVEVASGKTVNAWDMKGQSGLLTFFMDSPAHLLDKPLSDLVYRLSGNQRPGESALTLF